MGPGAGGGGVGGKSLVVDLGGGDDGQGGVDKLYH